MLVRMLLAACVLSASAARAADDPVARLRRETVQLRERPQKPPEGAPAATAVIGSAPAARFDGERAAAIAFVDMVRRLPDQRMEYCAYILREAGGKFGIGPIRQGDMNHCPADRPKPADATASVHTHPIWGRPGDVSAASQVFSEGDYAFAESAEMHFPIYLGAPAGHILRYAPGGSSCRGRSFIRRDFEIVRDLRPSVRGRLPVNPGVDMPLYDEGGRRLPKPSYCRPL